jgi:hypothetical protein
VITAPLWAIEALTSELAAVEAEDLRRTATAAVAPHLKDGDRRAFFQQLRAATEPQGIIPRVPTPLVARDPAAAAAWFASQGVHVVRMEAP